MTKKTIFYSKVLSAGKESLFKNNKKRLHSSLWGTLDYVLTYERSISSKVMPAQNSPTNIVGKKVNTMHEEYIIVCQKV